MLRAVARGVDTGIFREVDPQANPLKLAAYSDGLGTQLAQGAQGLTSVVARAWMLEYVDLLLSP